MIHLTKEHTKDIRLKDTEKGHFVPFVRDMSLSRFDKNTSRHA